MQFLVILLSSLAFVGAQATFNPQGLDNGGAGGTISAPVDISHLYDNRGFAMKPNDADFDGYGSK